MGVALWRRAVVNAEPDASLSYLPPATPGCRYRIEVFGEARAPWRSTPARAMADAIALDLASFDASRDEHYLAVPVGMRVWHPEVVR